MLKINFNEKIKMQKNAVMRDAESYFINTAEINFKKDYFMIIVSANQKLELKLLQNIIKKKINLKN